MKIEMKEMTPAEAAKFLRELCELTACGSGNWDNAQAVMEQFITSAYEGGKNKRRSRAEGRMMVASIFADMRAALKDISDAVGEGYLVSCSWDGSLLRIAIGRRADNPESWRKPWVMTFDSESDYSSDPVDLVAELVRGAKNWFASAPEKEPEPVR